MFRYIDELKIKNNMKVVLEQSEVLELIHDSLCNSSMLAQCGIQLNHTEEQYAEAKARLLEEKPDRGLCREDVWSEILKGEGKLAFYDTEGEEDLEITIEGAIKNLQTCDDAMKHILDMKNENDDAITASAILEICLFGEITFC